MFFLQSSILLNNKISHAFFSRIGGHSIGEYDSLNCSIKSADPMVDRNINTAANAIGADFANIRLLYQVHSNKVITIRDKKTITNQAEADAMVSNVPGIALAVYTADCAPIILQDYINGVIGIVHVGWRGALGGVIENTIGAMKDIGALNIKAAIGPCIRQRSYEVDEIFMNRFVQQNSLFDKFFIQSIHKKHYMFDLPGFCLSILHKMDIECEDSQMDTYTNEPIFFSYRRSCHNKLNDKSPVKHGCNISIVSLLQ
jgi:polyphenol oxidase